MKIILFFITCLTCVLGILLDYYNVMDREFGEPLYRLSLSILIPLTVLLFTKKPLFDYWFQFARWWIPISVLLILISPTTQNAWVSLFPFTRENMTLLMSTLFVLLSLYRIMRYVLKNRSDFVPFDIDR